MKKFLFVILIIAALSVAAYAAEEKLGQGDFVSNTMNTVFDKLRGYATGERKLVDMDRKSWGLDQTPPPDMTQRQLDNITIRSTPKTATPEQK
jgi:hypothetical protein